MIGATCGKCGAPWVVAWFTGMPSREAVEIVNQTAAQLGREPFLIPDAPAGDDFEPVFTCPKCGEVNRREEWRGANAVGADVRQVG